MNQAEMQIDTFQLKTLRQTKGWTQQHLADVSGISLRTIQRAESKGSVSTETLNSLCAVFELNREELQRPTQSEKDKIINKGFRVALISVALAQVLLIMMVWVFVGSINLLWLKTLLLSWVVIGFIYFVYLSTLTSHKLKDYQALKELNKKTRS
ncbi:helix-turn-helix transcriptional regulator [Marinicella sp. S1101]|uniref:helix-turn-helix domain-containing protein n=1 Tax=Marinicella marina TaxID=2996016 RepID=UPI0022609C8C|nr:helix-turn-helix transcriptional regulator [Marinicella marina]MCX7553335.1 helix-turn-helix transcriptional regulator [Marinicella marina]MDJ1139067.1 helix-turn-helix transcriptional regulator [Marinicella marina]